MIVNARLNESFGQEQIDQQFVLPFFSVIITTYNRSALLKRAAKDEAQNEALGIKDIIS